MIRMILAIAMILFSTFFFGCFEQSAKVADKGAVYTAKRSFHTFDMDYYPPLDAEGYVKKVDYFTIVFDPSASMTEMYVPSYDCAACHSSYQDPGFAQSHAVQYGGKPYEGKENAVKAMDCGSCHQDPHYSKFKFARALAQGINQSIPELDYYGTLRTFGYPAWTTFSYGLMENDNTKFKPYNKAEYHRALGELFDADGVSPLAPTLREIRKDFNKREGRIAVIVISDGKDMDDREVFAAEDLKEKFGENICIYTVLIGNDPFGRGILDRIAQKGKCGIAINGDRLLDKATMEKFVRQIFLTRDTPGPGNDGDMDGVPDDCDHCPQTIAGKRVDENGCWDLVLSADVLFDFDKYVLKPEGVIALNQVKAMLDRYPHLSVHISGHTDNYGSMAYNINLSKQRAKAGYDYLAAKGVAPRRMTMSWHSYTIPVASNNTAEGRALNRRLEFKFKKTK